MDNTQTARGSRSRLVFKLLPGLILLGVFYAFWVWAIYFPPGWVLAITGAGDETGKTYGFHSGFGGSLLFSAAIIFPIWYYARTCKHSWDCLLPGTYTLAGSGARVCKWHHPNPPREGETHHQWLHRLHTEQTVSTSAVTPGPAVDTAADAAAAADGPVEHDKEASVS